MTESSDWVSPTARRARAANPKLLAAPGGGTRRERREAREQATRTGRGGRARASGGATSSTRVATAEPESPDWQEAPTEPVPVVGGGGGRGGSDGGGRGRGGGGGNGNGNGSDAIRRRNMLVILVVGLLCLPFAAGAVYIVTQVASSGGGGTTKRTAPPGPQAGEVRLFLRPGLSLSQIGDVVATLPGHTKAAFLAEANKGTVRSQYQPATTNSLEGLLYPDTYFVADNESDASILHRLVTRFDQIGDEIGLGATTAVSPYQTIVVASLIQEEVKVPGDGPQVAAVIYNRLRQKMPLQIDATLCYVKGGCPPVPTNADKQKQSPYNTYLNPGLPPTPIASVTMESLQAAMQPANVPYLYYVIGDSTGKLVFANTLQQQNANIAAARRKGLL